MIELAFSHSDREPPTGAQTSGAFGIWETLVGPGKGPAPHTHETEIFRVIEGTFHARCGGQEFETSAGTVLVLPPGSNMPGAISATPWPV